MKKFASAFIVIIFPFVLLSQNAIEQKIDSLDDLAWDTAYNNPNIGIEITQEALRLADSVGYALGIINCTKHLATYHVDLSRFDQAKQYYFKSLKVAKENGYQERVASIYDNLSRLEKERGDYLKAIDYGFKSLNILKPMGKDRASMYLNIGLAHLYNRDEADAIKYYQKGIEVAKQSRDSFTLGLLYYNWGHLFRKSELFDQADSLFRKALPLFIEKEYLHGELIIYDEQSIIQRELGNYQLAKKIANKGITLIRQRADLDSLQLFYSYLNLSIISLRQSLFKDAIHYCDNAKSMVSDIDKLDVTRLLNKNYGDIYYALKDYKKAIPFYKKAEALKDSLFNTEKNTNILNLQKKHAEKEKAEADLLAENEKLARVQEELKSNKLLIVLGIISFLLLLLGFGLYIVNQRRIKKVNELKVHMEQKKRDLDRVVLVGTYRIRKELSKRVHNLVCSSLNHVGQFIRPVYQQVNFSPELSKPLSDALKIVDDAYNITRNISYRLEPIKTYWMDRINVSLLALEINDDIRTKFDVWGVKAEYYTEDQGEMISTIVYNLTDNAQKHAKADNIEVSIKQTNEELEILVKDNGVGFKLLEKKGVGLKGVEADVKTMGGTMRVDSIENKGTTFRINIPLKIQKP